MPPLGRQRSAAGSGRPVYAKVSLWDRLDAYATTQHLSRSQVFVIAITAYLDRVAPITGAADAGSGKGVAT